MQNLADTEVYLFLFVILWEPNMAYNIILFLVILPFLPSSSAPQQPNEVGHVNEKDWVQVTQWDSIES